MYKNYCMEFTNEEIEEFLVKEFINNPDIKINRMSSDGDIISSDSIIPIETLSLDGEKENLFINFLGIQTSIFVNDTEIMLIDESAKGTYTSSDVYHNVVYEGELRCLEHSEILRLICEIVDCFINNKVNEVIDSELSGNKNDQRYHYYVPHCYVINVIKNQPNTKQKIFENITINY